ncbi:MAG: NADH-quinone oxidoreductase subunit C [Aggregatilineales bacterium]|nr:NADH-quinone oxidoreductase subunit C [Aggregatilineales bacterium]
MSLEQRITEARARLEPLVESVEQPAPDRVDATIPADKLLDAASALIKDEWSYLTTITGLDLGVEAGEMAFLYHFSAGALLVTLRVHVPRSEPIIPSVCGIIPTATLYERELMEMFGVTITGTPNTERLFLPEDWPAGVYPLRKDFDPSQPEIVVQKDAAE